MPTQDIDVSRQFLDLPSGRRILTSTGSILVAISRANTHEFTGRRDGPLKEYTLGDLAVMSGETSVSLETFCVIPRFARLQGNDHIFVNRRAVEHTERWSQNVLQNTKGFFCRWHDVHLLMTLEGFTASPLYAHGVCFQLDQLESSEKTPMWECNRCGSLADED